MVPSREKTNKVQGVIAYMKEAEKDIGERDEIELEKLRDAMDEDVARRMGVQTHRI